jgi:hypothetical protein
MIRINSIFLAIICGIVTLISFFNDGNLYTLWYGNLFIRILILSFCIFGISVFFVNNLMKFTRPFSLIYIFMSFYINVVFMIKNIGTVLSASNAGIHGNWDVILMDVALRHSAIFLLIAFFAYAAGWHRDASGSAGTGA